MASVVAVTPDAPGLTEAEAQRRLTAAGERRGAPSSRSVASIVRANVLTVFNLILLAFGVVTIAFGDWRDALFLIILVANASIGIAQELRAKRALDRLASLVAPTGRVVRDGAATLVPAGRVVVGDHLLLEPGDQLVADGVLVADRDLLLDESVLSGESLPVRRHAGDAVRSGAFVVEGTGALEAAAVGEESYAERLLGEARGFRHPRSPLERAINRLLFVTVGLMVALGALLGYALAHRHAGTRDAVATATAGVVSLVPEGLVLLVGLTFAVGAVRMSRRGVLAQQLNAIESLAAADVICMDKTGTLTEPDLRVVAVVPAPGHDRDEVRAALARYAASATARNGTLEAIARELPGTAEPAGDERAFASRRRWSALRLGPTTFVLGAPEVVGGEMADLAAGFQRDGRRVVALASTPAPLPGDEGLPAQLAPVGLAVLSERLRPGAADTVAYLRRQGVQLLVLSGDAPETVAAIARDVGLPDGAVLRGDELPADERELGELLARTVVIGRISPEGKRDVVVALGRRGHHVAMIGDGVNDVPALKAARLAIAQGSGAQMARSVADLVLVQGDFAVVPRLIAEGRQMLRNLQRVAKLYVSKSAFAAFLILTIGITSTAYPLLPRHFSLAATLTIGIPTFVLALAPSSGPWRSEGFVGEVARFAIPAGVLAGVGVVSSHLFALHDLDQSVPVARTVATTVLVAVGLYLVLVLDATGRKRATVVGTMCALLGAGYAAVLLLPATRRFFDLATIGPGLLATSAVAAAVSIGALAVAGYTPGSGDTLARPRMPAGPGGEEASVPPEAGEHRAEQEQAELTIAPGGDGS